MNSADPIITKTISQSQKVIEHERFCVGLIVRRGPVISQQFVSPQLAFESSKGEKHLEEMSDTDNNILMRNCSGAEIIQSSFPHATD